MIESFDYRGWHHELILVSESSCPIINERTGGEDWHDNLGRHIGVKFGFDKSKDHYTNYAKHGHWVAFQTDTRTGESVITVLNEAYANFLMNEAGVGKRKHVPNPRPRRG